MIRKSENRKSAKKKSGMAGMMSARGDREEEVSISRSKSPRLPPGENAMKKKADEEFERYK